MLLDWFGQGGGLPSRRLPRRRRCTPAVELLESRALLSAGTAVPCASTEIVADAGHTSAAAPITRKALVGSTHAGRHLTLTKHVRRHHKRHHRHHPPIATTTPASPLPAPIDIVPPPTSTDPPPPAGGRSAQQTVLDYLEQLKANPIQIELLTDESVQRVLPGQMVFFVRFQMYPVARAIPEPLSCQNLFFVGPDGKLTIVNDFQGLEDYFRGAAAPATNESAAKDVALVWLQLVEDLHQDGGFQFKTIDQATKVYAEGDGRKVTALAVVMAGGNGEINVELTFDGAGKLVTATQTSTIMPGPRPICHATKLLDADPLVRRICEADLLIMGRAAKSYLDEQRAQAHPELQQAIDRIWERILERDRK
jgi:hypothetical protein